MVELKNIYKSINGFFKSLNKKRKFQFLLVSIFNVLSGYFEFLTVTSIAIFITSLAQPEALYNFVLVKYLNTIFLFKDTNDLKNFILLGFILIVFTSSIIRLFNLWFSLRFKVEYLKDLSKRSFQKVLSQEYEYFINKSSSELISDLTQNMDQTNVFISYLLSIFTYSVSLISIIIGIFSINFEISFSIILTIGLIYILISYFITNKVARYGKVIVRANNDSIKSLQEGLGSIKEIILNKNITFYSNKFSTSFGLAKSKQNLANLLAQCPKFVVEGLGLILIALAGYAFSSTSQGLINVGILGTIVLGLQKLLPAIQNIYAAWTNILSSSKGFERILFLLRLPSQNVNIDLIKNNIFNHNIIFKNTSYSYPNAAKSSINNINLTIYKGEKIGLIGKTGSGKSTFINLLMGLLTPSSGEILLDSKNLFLDENKEILISWRKIIGLVPQKIFVAQTTILENIAFLKNKKHINFEKVKKSAKTACIYQYINSSKNKFHTLVGEEGINMSGGQLQRLGIARALYKDSKVLILDEGTSSLDKRTEQTIIENLNQLNNKMTLILISHELSALKNCNRIIEFEDGEIKNIYSSDEFKKTNNL